MINEIDYICDIGRINYQRIIMIIGEIIKKILRGENISYRIFQCYFFEVFREIKKLFNYLVYMNYWFNMI